MAVFDYAELEWLVGENSFDGAADLCRVAAAASPDPRFWKTQLGYVLFLSEPVGSDRKQSVDHFQMMVTEDKTDVNARFWLGYLYSLFPYREDKAQNELHQVLKLDRNHAYAYEVLASFDNEDPDLNVILLRRVLELQPTNYQALNALADRFLGMGRRSEAYQLLKVILEQPAYTEQNYGIMNRYLNESLTGAKNQLAIRGKAQVKLKG